MTAAISIVAIATTTIVLYKLAHLERELNNLTGALMKKGLVREDDF
jgi:hypothetical protein